MAYRPPEQNLLGQIIDVFVLLVLTVGSLFVPLYLGLAGATKTPNALVGLVLFASVMIVRRRRR